MSSRIDIRFDSLLARGRELFEKHSLPTWVVFALEGFTILVTFYFAYFLRYNFELDAIDLNTAFIQSLVVFGVYSLFVLVFRSYTGLIRYTTIRDVFNVLNSNTVSLLALILISVLFRLISISEVLDLPISILLIHFVTVGIMQLVIRICIKMIYEFVIASKDATRKKAIIFGAGSMGNIVRHALAGDHNSGYNIVAFFDNNRKMHSKELTGIPVHHPKMLTKDFLEKNGVGKMIFAIQSIPQSEKADILNMAVDLGLEVLDVPAVSKWLNGGFDVQHLKKIKLEDLLRRDPIQINMEAIGKGLKLKNVLVTGAAGSIGSELTRQLTNFDIRQIILIDNAETPLFILQNELEENFPHASIKPILADATDHIKMEWVFKSYRPDIVFHAAAYKHVPLMEDNPHEGIRVNVQSSLILSKLSQAYEVEKFVLVSTDKAVNPTNVMGATKRLSEIILQARSKEPNNKVQFVITRFGNVLGSNGSVVPLFKQQIEGGGPIKVTHPEITRYFMTIPEACQLVLEAGFMGLGGEIYIFDMGDPIKISDLARQMIKLSGYEPGRDIEIEYTGLRPGEKLYEELFSATETTVPTENPKLLIAKVSSLDHHLLMPKIYTFLSSYYNFSVKEIFSNLKEIVPEFTPWKVNDHPVKVHNPENFSILPD